MDGVLIPLFLWIVRKYPHLPWNWRLIAFLRKRKSFLHDRPRWRMPNRAGISIEVNPITNVDVYIEGISSGASFMEAAKLLRPGDVVLDIGANMGLTALTFAKAVAPSGHVEAFEAWPAVADDLRHNVALNPQLDVRIHDVAVTDRNGSVEIATPKADASALASIRDAGCDVTRTSVPTIAIDSMLDQLPAIRLVKIDIEGAEYLALYGMRKLLARDRPILLIEMTDAWLRQLGASADAVVDLLKEFGYELFELTGAGRQPLSKVPTHQAEVLALP